MASSQGTDAGKSSIYVLKISVYCCALFKTYHPDNNTTAYPHWKSICLLIIQAIDASELVSARGLQKLAQTGSWYLLWNTIVKNHPHPDACARLDATIVTQWETRKQFREIYLV